MAVSANTLFHFTKSDALKSILSSQGLFAQYSDEHFEDIFPEKSNFRFNYIPMISFCDLTIMQLSGDSKHRENFGEYGIGLTKEWGIRNKVSPVIYVHEKSQPSNQLQQLYKLLYNFPKNKNYSDGITGIKRELVDSIKYFKPYKGRWHKGIRIDNTLPDLNYYNEREWRFCPSLNEYQVLSAIKRYNKKKKEAFNSELKTKLIKFDSDDIKFIVIKDKSEKNGFVKIIEKMSIKTKQKNELITNIISFEEISEDY